MSEEQDRLNENDGDLKSFEDEITTNWDETTETFDELDLKEELLRGIYAYGFEKPSAIQQVSGDCLVHVYIVVNILFAFLDHHREPSSQFY